MDLFPTSFAFAEKYGAGKIIGHFFHSVKGL